MSVPEVRIEPMNGKPVHAHRRFVLSRRIASRRTTSNFGLERAAGTARGLSRPPPEAPRCDYRWASDRIRAAILRGMKENAARSAKAAFGRFPYVEPKRGRRYGGA